MNTCLRAIACLALAIAGLSCHQASHEATENQVLKPATIPITTTSDDARRDYLQGLALADRGRTEEARVYFEEALAADSRFALATMQLAFIQTKADAFFAHFHQAKRLIGKVSPGERLWMLGEEAGAIQGNPMKQRQFFTELAATYPGDARAHMLLGAHLHGQQEYLLAVASLEKALTIEADFVPALRKLGQTYREMDRFEEAARVLSRYRDLLPEDAQAHADFAALMLQMSRYDASLQACEAALVQDPHHQEAQVGIATNLNYLDRHEEARARITAFSAAALNDTERRALWYAMAVSWVDEGKIQEGLAALEKRLELAEKQGDMTAVASDYNTIGFVQLESNRIEEARTSFDRAHTLVEQSTLLEPFKEKMRRGSQFIAARVAIEQGKMDRARLYAQSYQAAVEAIASPAGMRRAHELNGLIALKSKDYESALEAFSRSDLRDTRNLYRLALTHERKGDADAGRRRRQQALEVNPLNSIKHALIRNQLGQRMAHM